jgi:hypothetical protein
MLRRSYEKAKYGLQVELLKLQSWTKEQKQKVVILFEGRDAAGKGGAIKRFISIRAARGSWPSRSRRRRSAANGISSAMCRSCRPPVKSCCSTAPGTIERESKG